jgi:hypothetical protein
MHSQEIHNKEIEELLNDSGGPCVSIIIPLHRVSPERLIDATVVSKAVKHAKELLSQVYPDIDNTMLIKGIDELVNKIDLTHCKDGIGIFVSQRIARSIKFPFPVTEKIKVGDVFDSRDLLYHANSVLDYCVFSITKKRLHLFSGKGEELKEIKNEDFPIDFIDNYEYSKPTRGTSFGSNTLKEFEKDKSVLQEIRLVDFLRTADHVIGKYVNNHVPLIVSGGTKEIADYLQITQHKQKIIGKVSGNYNFNGDLQLTGLAWEEVQNYFKKQNITLLTDLRELVGKNMIVIGMEEVWKASNEGKGLDLIVEKDFECGAYISPDGFDLSLGKPSEEKKFLYVNDAVEKIIKIVREKKGKIVFTDNGEMETFDHIALKLRYNNS